MGYAGKRTLPLERREMERMIAMVNRSRVEDEWLSQEEVELKEPADNEVLVRVRACGVCRTDLHIVEGDLQPIIDGLVPGHEIVGTVVRAGRSVVGVSEGDTVGIMWLHSTCGRCDYCVRGQENLCASKEFTGYSVNGGYAEYAIGRGGFVLPLPRGINPERSAPLMCSGIIGYRALKLALPPPGGRLGIFGFGGSAHITVQMASKLGIEVCVVSRGEEHLKLAQRLGAAETWISSKSTPEDIGRKFDSAIVFAPAGEVAKQALECIKPGGCVAVPAVHLDRLPEMDYQKNLFREKRLFSVEANTRADATEFLSMAFRLGVRSEVEVFSLGQANRALKNLKHGRINGAAVLKIT